MKSNRFGLWLKNIYHTHEDEISCSECFDLVSSVVEIELSGQDPAAKFPQVIQHLQQCPACREEYETLRDLQRFEDEGGPVSTDDLRGLIH